MNPELRRMLWLEVSPQRLWLIPGAVLGGALVIARALPAAVTTLALLAFVALTALWGARQAANAVLDEVREHTWDIQRMAALAPWPMAWGKLVGATLMPWYAGVLCLGVYAVHRPPELAGETLVRIVFAVLAALALQGFALTAALVGVHAERRVRARPSLVLVLLLLGLVLPLPDALTLPDASRAGAGAPAVEWYGHGIPLTALALAQLALLATFMIAGAYRTMCIELQVRTTPWLWLAFIAWLATLLAGFGGSATGPAFAQRWFSSAAIVACALSYAAAFAFARDPVQYRRVLQALTERRWRRALEDLPLALSSAAIALVLGAVAAVLGSDTLVTNQRIDNTGPVALALVLLMIRDLGLLVATSFHDRTRRAEITTLVYLAVLNRIAPALLALAGLAPLAALCLPPVFEAPYAALAIAGVHALAGIALAARAFRHVMRPLSPPGDRRS